MKLLPNPKKLDNRGISHLLVPLLIVVVVAVGGVFALVSSHAEVPTAKKGYLVVTGALANGTSPGYDSVQIVAHNLDDKHKCGGTFKASANSSEGKVVELKLKQGADKTVAPSKQVSCSPTGGLGKYEINYREVGVPVNGGVTVAGYGVDVDPGVCTFIYADGTQNKAPASGTTCKDPTPPNTTLQKTDAISRVVLPKVTKYQKTVTGYVEVHPNFSLDLKHQYECAGQITLDIRESGTLIDTKQLPLKYTVNKDKPNNGYCVAKFKVGTAKALDGDKVYSFAADFKGNSYFNPVTASDGINMPAVNATAPGTTIH